jgi:hypothetical protein
MPEPEPLLPEAAMFGIARLLAPGEALQSLDLLNVRQQHAVGRIAASCVPMLYACAAMSERR